MFGRFEDWGLQAIVDASNNIDEMENVQGHQSSTLGIWGIPQDDESFFLGFPLETLYKPFYKVKDSISTQEVKTELEKVEVIERTHHHHQEVIQPEGDSKIVRQQSSSSTVLTTAYSPRFKKRKNQQKRVVTQVKAEDYLTSDMWAWRKYGQKPIKGSPYPRSYYRCSSMKGCLARKQVEQSCTDPQVYIITYTEEHCHSQPTRRNSLAGTVRNKFPATPQNPIMPTTSTGGNNSPPLPSNADISSTSLPLNESSEEELSGTHFKQENIDEELRTMQWGCSSNGDPSIISDFLMFDDFFYGLEDLNCPKV